MGMTKHSHHHHLMVILSPTYTGSQKKTMRLLTLPLKSALQHWWHYKMLKKTLKTGDATKR